MQTVLHSEGTTRALRHGAYTPSGSTPLHRRDIRQHAAAHTYTITQHAAAHTHTSSSTSLHTHTPSRSTPLHTHIRQHTTAHTKDQAARHCTHKRSGRTPLHTQKIRQHATAHTHQAARHCTHKRSGSTPLHTHIRQHATAHSALSQNVLLHFVFKLASDLTPSGGLPHRRPPVVGLWRDTRRFVWVVGLPAERQCHSKLLCIDGKHLLLWKTREANESAARAEQLAFRHPNSVRIHTHPPITLPTDSYGCESRSLISTKTHHEQSSENYICI